MPKRLAVTGRNFNRLGQTKASKGVVHADLPISLGEDDSAFCHKVTKALSEGWVLHGSTSYAYDAMNKKMAAGRR